MLKFVVYSCECMTIIYVYIYFMLTSLQRRSLSYSLSLLSFLVFGFWCLEESSDIMSRSLGLLNFLELDFSFTKPFLLGQFL